MARGDLRSVLAHRDLRILFLGNLAQALGLQLFAPILPIYLAGRGVSSTIVGLTIAAGVLGYGVAQFPGGRIADTFDRRAIIVYGMGVYALLFLIYLLPIPALLLPPVRFLHAALGGVYGVAAIAAVGDLTPRELHGRVYGMWQATSRAGFLIGPLIGGVIATFNLAADFVVCAAAYVLTTGLMMLLPKQPPAGSPHAVESSPEQLDPGPTAPRRLSKSLMPLIGVASAGDYCAGLITAVWSLWLLSQGASPWQIGVSFCMFAIPSVALSPYFGSFHDRGSSRGLLVITLIGLILVAPLASMFTSVIMLSGLAVILGLLSAPARPITFAAVGHEYAGTNRAATAQGSLQGGLMGAQFLASIVGGALLDVSPLAAFSSISAVGVLSLWWAIRRR